MVECIIRASHPDNPPPLHGATDEDSLSQPLRVLMVEDVEEDAELIASQITRSGYKATYLRVDTLAKLTEALDGQHWDLILTDYTMPKLTVPMVLKLVRQRSPGIPCILVSGTASQEAAKIAMRLGVDDFVSKVDLNALGPVVARARDDAHARRAWLQVPRVRFQSGHELRLTAKAPYGGVLEGGTALTPGQDRDGLLIGEEAATWVHMRVLECAVWALTATRILYRTTIKVPAGW